VQQWDYRVDAVTDRNDLRSTFKGGRKKRNELTATADVFTDAKSVSVLLMLAFPKGKFVSLGFTTSSFIATLVILHGTQSHSFGRRRRRNHPRNGLAFTGEQ
jgi:hypothetical protein